MHLLLTSIFGFQISDGSKTKKFLLISWLYQARLLSNHSYKSAHFTFNFYVAGVVVFKPVCYMNVCIFIIHLDKSLWIYLWIFFIFIGCKKLQYFSVTMISVGNLIDFMQSIHWGLWLSVFLINFFFKMKSFSFN